MAFLNQIIIKGFKSIRDMTLELRPLNILIGANGAGKSNLVLFFKMLNEMMGGRLQQFIATSGRAQSILHFGPKITPQVSAILQFTVDNGIETYQIRMFHAAGDTLVFAEEILSFQQTGYPQPKKLSLGTGHQETLITDEAEEGAAMARVFRRLLNNCRVYHFHDTSPTARIRQYCYLGDSRWLMPDAGNLAAVLYRLKTQNGGAAYNRIVKTVGMIAPFFDDFDLAPSAENGRDIILNWRHVESPQIFGPHQLSDGTLRAICLVTLLLQPEDELPELIIVDEPELGLHPYALNVIASLFKKASHHAQVIVSTQSSAFLDNFAPEDIVVVDRTDKESTFRRLNSAELGTWLEEYSLGEIWEKNVIQGGPH
ncbi:MAG: AAA family ATPase [Pirellulaceae bacterium]|nr:AAA family ATPase [Pirellulaceae bacterium]